MNKTSQYITFVAIWILIFLNSCNSSSSKQTTVKQDDTLTVKQTIVTDSLPSSSHKSPENQPQTTLSDQATVLVYNFHTTNRCSSCIAIEEATTKTLNTYFSKEIQQGIVKRYILNVDEKANKSIAEKYQVFGSSILVVKKLKEKETISDLTGDGFKFARNKEERFIDILKSKIDEYIQ